MNLLWFCLFGQLIFLSLLLGMKKYRSTVLYTLAIGGVVNANFFHAGNYPIEIFGLNFGIDSIIYTLFIFCVVVMFIESGKREAYILAISGILAILFSAVMQLISDLLSNGSSWEVWSVFVGFVLSIIASIGAIVVMLEVLGKLKNKSHYILTVVGIFIATVINSVIYYPLSLLLGGMPENMGELLLSSFVGKTFALVFAVVTLLMLRIMDKKMSRRNQD